MISTRALFASSALVLFACSDDASNGPSGSSPSGATASCTKNEDCATVAGKTSCDAAKKVCVAPPQGSAIGTGDGSASSVDFAEVTTMTASNQPIDLAFHPERQDELWVIAYQSSAIYLGQGIGGDSPTWKRLRDPAAQHFMYKPPAIAMGAADTWATCGNNDNKQNLGGAGADGAGVEFMGPSLFSADLDIFAKATPTGLGSHLDMLHNTSFCRGIAHDKDNVYWAFNSNDGSIDKYNFNVDHGPGNDDHSDGEIYRHIAGEVKGAADETPSHLTLDRESGFVYVADTGNGRVVRFDPSKATKGGKLDRTNETLKGQAIMEGATAEVVVAPGKLTAPAGIELRDRLLYVTDAATSKFHVFTLEGAEVRSLATDLEPKSLAGFTFGPDGKVYFTDRVKNRVLRIDPK